MDALDINATKTKADPSIVYDTVAINAQKIWDETKGIFEETPKNLALADLTKEHKGRLSIKVHGVAFESCFLKKDPKSLFVFLSGPARPDYTQAFFWRKSYSSYFEESALYIDDPCNLEKKYAPTFFWGNNEHSYMDYVLEIVRKFQEVYNIQNSDIVFLGECNTALAALYCCAKTPTSLCLAFSPIVNIRIYLQDYDYFDIFHQMFDYDFHDHALEDRIDISDLIISNKKSKYFITSNLNYYADSTQMNFLLEKLHSKPKLGLSTIDNFTFYFANADLLVPHLFIPNEAFCRYMYSYIKAGKFEKRYYFEFDALSKSLYWYRKEVDEHNEAKKALKVLKRQKRKVKESLGKIEEEDIEIKNSFAFIIGSKIEDFIKKHNPISYIFLPFIIILECIKNKNLIKK